jgi:hypothetical protein
VLLLRGLLSEYFFIFHKSEDYFKLSFIVTKLVNLDAMLGGYFILYFIIANVGNLDTNLWGYFELFL